jgi:hypothetical protein
MKKRKIKMILRRNKGRLIRLFRLITLLAFISVLIILYRSDEKQQPQIKREVIYKAYAEKKEDIRVIKLRKFLQEKNSPLAPYAEYIVKKSDAMAVEWTKIVAIAGMESSYGTQIKEGSFNPFGLGGASGFMYFSNWQEAIDYEINLLSKHYRFNENKGIGEKYCPAYECNSRWAEIVTSISEEIIN